MAPKGYRRKASTRRYKRRTYRRTGALYRVARKVAYNIAETKYWESGVITPDPNAYGIWGGQTGGNASASMNVWSRIDILNPIPVGNGVNQRIGNKIMVKYIQIYITIGQGNVTDAESGTCRFLLIRDKASDGNLIDMTGAYFTPNGPMLQSQSLPINAPKDYNNLRRFSTLLDRQHSVQLFGNAVGSKSATPCMQFYIPVNRVFTYRSESTNWSTAANMVQETIQFALAADMAGCCNVSAFIRVAFKDA